MVCPTISGTIVDRLDHVRITRFSRDLFSAPTLSIRCPSTNGPFWTDRLMRARASPPYPAARRGPPCLPPVAHDPLGAPLRLLPGPVAQRRLAPRADRDRARTQRVSGPDLCCGPRGDDVAHRQAARGQDVALLAVPVVEEGDPRGPVRVVLDAGHPGGDPVLVALEVDQPIPAFVAAPLVPDGQFPLRV